MIRRSLRGTWLAALFLIGAICPVAWGQGVPPASGPVTGQRGTVQPVRPQGPPPAPAERKTPSARIPKRLPGTVSTGGMTMTGVGPAGKAIPKSISTAGIVMTGVGASSVKLPAVVPTGGLTMTAAGALPVVLPAAVPTPGLTMTGNW